MPDPHHCLTTPPRRGFPRRGWGAAVLTLLAGLMLLAGPRDLPAQPADGESGGRRTVAVPDLEAAGAEPGQTAAVSDRLREELIRGGGFDLIEAGRLAAAEDERRAETGCAGTACTFGAARALGAEAIVTGRLSRLDAGTWQISAQLVDAESERTERARSVLHEGRFVGLLNEAVPRLAAELAGEPTAEAEAPEAPAPLPEPEPEPPAEKPTMVRFWGAPESHVIDFTLELKGGGTVDETWAGGGFAIGLDVILDQYVALWGAVHGGSIDQIDRSGGGQGSDSFTNVDGTYTTVAGGVDIVGEAHPWRALIGGGLFSTTAEIDRVGGEKVDRDAQIGGLLFDGRLDYTFESGWFVGGAIYLAFGGVEGSVTDGTKDASAVVTALYIPVGISF